MSKRNIARVKAHNNSLKFLKDNASVYSGFTPLEEFIVAFTLALQSLDKHNEVKSKKTKGSTDKKTEVRITMAVVVSSLAKKAIVWARKNNKWTEVAILDVEESDLRYGDLQSAVNLAKNVYNVLQENKAELAAYRITDVHIEELKKVIEDMGEVETMPRQSRDQKTKAGKDITDGLKTLDTIDSNIEDLIVGEFRRSNPGFVDGYLIAKRIDDPAFRRTLLLVSVKNQEGLPVENALCDILEMDDEEQLTNNLGVAEIRTKSGSYQLEVSKEGYQTVRQPFNITRSQRISLEIVLKKA